MESNVLLLIGNDKMSYKLASKVQEIHPKQPQNTENRHKMTHHIAKSSRRAPKVHPRVPKDAQKEACDNLSNDLVIDFGAGGPQGRPRARGVYLINQVKKE